MRSVIVFTNEITETQSFYSLRCERKNDFHRFSPSKTQHRQSQKLSFQLGYKIVHVYSYLILIVGLTVSELPVYPFCDSIFIEITP